mmetsp:Transcript_17414/g.53818  ORF Transcript_17414/g.53818 Transcript_17414/m.53818 type:complete len:206 (-) Transcript_17414:2-619(-)
MGPSVPLHAQSLADASEGADARQHWWQVASHRHHLLLGTQDHGDIHTLRRGHRVGAKATALEALAAARATLAVRPVGALGGGVADQGAVLVPRGRLQGARRLCCGARRHVAGAGGVRARAGRAAEVAGDLRHLHNHLPVHAAALGVAVVRRVSAGRRGGGGRQQRCEDGAGSPASHCCAGGYGLGAGGAARGKQPHGCQFHLQQT